MGTGWMEVPNDSRGYLSRRQPRYLQFAIMQFDLCRTIANSACSDVLCTMLTVFAVLACIARGCANAGCHLGSCGNAKEQNLDKRIGPYHVLGMGYGLIPPGISKRGNVYLRKILIHGARTAVLRIKRDRAPIGPWLNAVDARAPKNVVVVAMANKLARIAWAVLSSGFTNPIHLGVKPASVPVGVYPAKCPAFPCQEVILSRVL